MEDDSSPPPNVSLPSRDTTLADWMEAGQMRWVREDAASSSSSVAVDEIDGNAPTVHAGDADPREPLQVNRSSRQPQQVTLRPRPLAVASTYPAYPWQVSDRIVRPGFSGTRSETFTRHSNVANAQTINERSQIFDRQRHTSDEWARNNRVDQGRVENPAPLTGYLPGSGPEDQITAQTPTKRRHLSDPDEEKCSPTKRVTHGKGNDKCRSQGDLTRPSEGHLAEVLDLFFFHNQSEVDDQLRHGAVQDVLKCSKLLCFCHIRRGDECPALNMSSQHGDSPWQPGNDSQTTLQSLPEPTTVNVDYLSSSHSYTRQLRNMRQQLGRIRSEATLQPSLEQSSARDNILRSVLDTTQARDVPTLSRTGRSRAIGSHLPESRQTVNATLTSSSTDTRQNLDIPWSSNSLQLRAAITNSQEQNATRGFNVTSADIRPSSSHLTFRVNFPNLQEQFSSIAFDAAPTNAAERRNTQGNSSESDTSISPTMAQLSHEPTPTVNLNAMPSSTRGGWEPGDFASQIDPIIPDAATPNLQEAISAEDEGVPQSSSDTWQNCNSQLLSGPERSAATVHHLPQPRPTTNFDGMPSGGDSRQIQDESPLLNITRSRTTIQHLPESSSSVGFNIRIPSDACTLQPRNFSEQLDPASSQATVHSILEQNSQRNSDAIPSTVSSITYHGNVQHLNEQNPATNSDLTKDFFPQSDTSTSPSPVQCSHELRPTVNLDALPNSVRGGWQTEDFTSQINPIIPDDTPPTLQEISAVNSDVVPSSSDTCPNRDVYDVPSSNAGARQTAYIYPQANVQNLNQQNPTTNSDIARDFSPRSDTSISPSSVQPSHEPRPTVNLDAMPSNIRGDWQPGDFASQIDHIIPNAKTPNPHEARSTENLNVTSSREDAGQVHDVQPVSDSKSARTTIHYMPEQRPPVNLDEIPTSPTGVLQSAQGSSSETLAPEALLPPAYDLEQVQHDDIMRAIVATSEQTQTRSLQEMSGTRRHGSGAEQNSDGFRTRSNRGQEVQQEQPQGVTTLSETSDGGEVSGMDAQASGSTAITDDFRERWFEVNLLTERFGELSGETRTWLDKVKTLLKNRQMQQLLDQQHRLFQQQEQQRIQEQQPQNNQSHPHPHPPSNSRMPCFLVIPVSQTLVQSSSSHSSPSIEQPQTREQLHLERRPQPQPTLVYSKPRSEPEFRGRERQKSFQQHQQGTQRQETVQRQEGVTIHWLPSLEDETSRATQDSSSNYTSDEHQQQGQQISPHVLQHPRPRRQHSDSLQQTPLLPRVPVCTASETSSHHELYQGQFTERSSNFASSSVSQLPVTSPHTVPPCERPGQDTPATQPGPSRSNNRLESGSDSLGSQNERPERACRSESSRTLPILSVPTFTPQVQPGPLNTRPLDSEQRGSSTLFHDRSRIFPRISHHLSISTPRLSGQSVPHQGLPQESLRASTNNNTNTPRATTASEERALDLSMKRDTDMADRGAEIRESSLRSNVQQFSDIRHPRPLSCPSAPPQPTSLSQRLSLGCNRWERRSSLASRQLEQEQGLDLSVRPVLRPSQLRDGESSGVSSPNVSIQTRPNLFSESSLNSVPSVVTQQSGTATTTRESHPNGATAQLSQLTRAPESQPVTVCTHSSRMTNIDESPVSHTHQLQQGLRLGTVSETESRGSEIHQPNSATQLDLNKESSSSEIRSRSQTFSNSPSGSETRKSPSHDDGTDIPADSSTSKTTILSDSNNNNPSTSVSFSPGSTSSRAFRKTVNLYEPQSSSSQRERSSQDSRSDSHTDNANEPSDVEMERPHLRSDDAYQASSAGSSLFRHPSRFESGTCSETKIQSNCKPASDSNPAASSSEAQSDNCTTPPSVGLGGGRGKQRRKAKKTRSRTNFRRKVTRKGSTNQPKSGAGRHSSPEQQNVLQANENSPGEGGRRRHKSKPTEPLVEMTSDDLGSSD